MLASAGFVDVSIAVKDRAADIIKEWMPGSGAENYVTSAYVTANKSASASSSAEKKDTVVWEEVPQKRWRVSAETSCGPGV